MKKIYIGGWFQRTMLHLAEIYSFLSEGVSNHVKLDKEKLLSNQKSMDIKELSLNVDGFECITYTTNKAINVKIFEDGLIVLNGNASGKDFEQDIKRLTAYYETVFSPAIGYLFSLGAPVPKELAGIKTVYPYFLVYDNASVKETDAVLNTLMEKQRYSNYKNDSFEVFGGEKYFLINTKKQGTKLRHVEKYIEETMFFREFKGQLHRYLNLHRQIWEDVSKLKEGICVDAKQINENTLLIEDYYKTINLVDARIKQMGTYLETREKIAKSDSDFKNFLGIMQYRYETLSNSLQYIKEIWTMTRNYVVAAKDLYAGFQTRVTQKVLGSLNINFGIMMTTTLIGLLSITSMPVFSWWGVLYCGVIIAVGFSVIKFLQWMSGRGKYKISDQDFKKMD